MQHAASCTHAMQMFAVDKAPRVRMHPGRVVARRALLATMLCALCVRTGVCGMSRIVRPMSRACEKGVRRKRISARVLCSQSPLLSLLALSSLC
jgi:hypothetical protein